MKRFLITTFLLIGVFAFSQSVFGAEIASFGDSHSVFWETSASSETSFYSFVASSNDTIGYIGFRGRQTNSGIISVVVTPVGSDASGCFASASSTEQNMTTMPPPFGTQPILSDVLSYVHVAGPYGGGSCTLVSGTTYNVRFQSTGFYSFFPAYLSGVDSFHPYFVLFDSGSGVLPALNQTRIISVVPENASTTATSTALTVGFTGYVNQSDWVDGQYLRLVLKWENSDCKQAAGIGFIDCNVLLDTTYANVVWGSFSFSTTTPVLENGYYDLEVGVYNPRWYWFDEEVVASSTYFLANEENWGDTIFSPHSTSSPIVPIYGTPTSTEAVRNMCNPFSGFFSMADCMLALIIPQNVGGFVAYTRTQVLSKWPIGYLTDFIDILKATTTKPLVVLNAVVPSVLPGAGSELTLTVDHVFDSVLYATSGPFLSGSATSTDTFYDITSYYWRILVYVGAGLYILRRILGSHLIPFVFH